MAGEILPDMDPGFNPGDINAVRDTGGAVTSASGDAYLNRYRLVRPKGARRTTFPAAKDEEIATLIVRGMIYEDWETVWYQWSLGDPYPTFRFTATEDDPRLPGSYNLRFTVGDECRLFLGGYPIMRGVILTRQVAYDKNNHTIVLQGAGLTWYAANASVISKTGEFHGTFEQIAEEVLAPTCSGMRVWGQISKLPFKDPVRAQQGESIFQFLETIGRDRKVIVTSDPFGDFLFIGEHEGEYVGDLVEGGNILKCQSVISVLKAHSEFIASGQSAANDEHNGSKAAEMKASVQGSGKCYMPLLTPIEHPVWTQEEVKLRAATEWMFNEGQGKIEATVTVQGWFNPRTGLRWDVGQKMRFVSPMTGIDNMVMKIRTVTYTQDRQGSLTTMVLVQPSGYNDSDLKTGAGAIPDAIFDVRPAADPPLRRPHSSDPTGLGKIESPA